MSATVPVPRSAVADRVAELAAGRELDLGSAELPADALATALAAGGGPLRVRRATVTGRLALVGARIERPVELLDCTFTVAPDLRMAEFTGLALTGCRMPGCRPGTCASPRTCCSTTASWPTSPCTCRTRRSAGRCGCPAGG